MRLLQPDDPTAYTYYPLPVAVYARRALLLYRLPDPVLVVGCGFGRLVVELQRLGKVAWGCDASPYAETNRVTDNFLLLDITAVTPSGHFATAITEDLLPWLTDFEAVTAANNCAAIAPLVLHLVTEQGQADYNYHSTGYWMRLLNQLVISLEGL